MKKEVMFPACERTWRDRLIAWGARRLVRPALAWPIPWSGHRIGFQIGGWLRPRARGVTIDEMSLGGRPCLRLTPLEITRRIVWIHGGGFVVGSPHTHLGPLTHLAVAARAEIIAPSYRLAPEHPFPAAVEDVTAAILAVQGDFTLAGDSAGGCLAIVALQELLARGRSPDALVLLSPATIIDIGQEVPEADDLLFPLSLLQHIADDYPGGHTFDDPKLSPAFGDYPSAPRTLIHCVVGEYLEAHTDAIAERLREFDTTVTVERAEKMPHVWHFMAGSSPVADRALARIAVFLDAA